MIKTTFKAHPIMVVSLMKPYLFILILPLVKALVQYLTTKTVDGLLNLEIVAFAVVLFMAILSYRAISVTVSQNRLTVEKGVIFRRKAVIELTRLSSIVLRQNPIDYCFGCVDCEINTEAGRNKKSDFSFKMHQTDTKRLFKMVYGDKEREIIKFSSTKIALLAATTSSAFSGMIIAVPVVNQIGDMLGVALSEMFLNEINIISYKMKTFFSPMANAVTLIILSAYIVAVLTSFLKNVNFKLQSDDETVEITSGLIIRRHIVFKKSQVNNICIEQTPLMRIAKKFSMRASVGGYSNIKGEKAVVVPIASYNGLRDELKKHFPEFESKKEFITPPQTAAARNRFFFMPMVWFIIITALSFGVAICFRPFDNLILFVMTVLLGLDLYYASVCYRTYKYSKLSFNGSVFVGGMAGFNVKELFCNKNNIGIIKVTQTPADKRYKTCKVKLVVRSEKADKVRVKILDTDTVVNAVKKEFNLKNIIL